VVESVKLTAHGYPQGVAIADPMNDAEMSYRWFHIRANYLLETALATFAMSTLYSPKPVRPTTIGPIQAGLQRFSPVLRNGINIWVDHTRAWEGASWQIHFGMPAASVP